MGNPIADLTKKEWCVWIGSLLIIIMSNFLSEGFDPLTLVAACIGVTSLIFAAKGNVWSQILMIIFSILYGIISWQFRYWGEMMTYLGMTMPHIFTNSQWNRCYNTVLYDFGSIKDTKYSIQHDICNDKFLCGIIDNA